MSTRLEILARNLKELEKRKSMHAPGEEPLFLLSQIEELKEQIRQEGGRELESLRHRYDEARENLRLIEERKSSYVLSTDIPLGLIKDERRLRDELKELEKRVRFLENLLESVRDRDPDEEMNGGDGNKREKRDEDETIEEIPFVLRLLHPQGGAPQVLVQHSGAGEDKPCPLKLPYAVEYLFSIDLDLGELDRKEASEKLREQFEEHNETLTSQALVEENRVGNHWKIIDGDREYVIRNEGQKLNVYGHNLALVMKALATSVGKLPADSFDDNEVKRLEHLGLVESGHLLERIYKVVGQCLYDALFPTEIERLFYAERNKARSKRRSLALRLIFDAGGATLASYPWELIHDDVPLVADGVVDLTRYIALPNPRSALEVNLPLRVLGIAPRPSGLPSLPLSDEPQAVSEGLTALAEREALEITWLSPPTRRALLETLQQEDVHIIHFDGHGSFGRLCPTCHILHTATSKHCVRCQYPLSTVDARGYLAFEDKDGKVNYVSARSFANALSRNKTQVVVLSACRSGQVGGASVFNGVGPALIQAGVPAVVAMQLPVPVDDAVRFARTFYISLASFHSLVEAVGRGRQQLYDETCNPRTWFVPTLYLRSDDPQGDVFHPIQSS